MKRAILVTTGTVVGITSVLAYKPSIDALTLVPGTESLSTTTEVKSAEASAATTTPSATATDAATAAATESAAASATPSATTAKASATTKATAKATAKTTASAKPSSSATSSASSTPTATPTATATPTPTATASGSFTDGTHTGNTATVESHGRNYGTLVATVTVSNGKMTDLSFAQTPEGRNAQFINAVNQYLVPEILRTQNVSVGIVTGATGTSMALINSLKSALGLA